MAISIDPLTFVIYVPKADLNLIQPSPEIRELDLDWFRLELKDYEDDPDLGIFLQKTHTHNTEVTLSGLTYARIIEILYPYTVEFEDDQYTVNCTGANHNLSDVKVPNQVSLIINNAAGLIVTNVGSGIIPQDIEDIADAVWDETLSEHLSAGSTGDALNNMSGGSSPSVIADAVWDESTAGHTSSNTFGGELATKSDIRSNSTTSQTSSISGAVIEGSEDSGTYVSTVLKDNIYWEIGENAATGITVDQIFYLPSVDHNPGTISVFGRYIGTPSLSHYIELWAWNYETSSYELLVEEFMPGGITSDDTFEHEYYERHVDRTNNNEVRIRLLHHTTTYNATHTLFIDYMDVSSIELITAEDIADAVWDENLTGHMTPNSTATAMKAATYFIGTVTLDTVKGVSGTGWPTGTHFKPSNNLTDALTIMYYGNVDDIEIDSDITIGATHDVSNIVIRTIGKMGTDVTLSPGCSANNTSFRNVNLSGTVTIGDQLLVYDSSIGNLENFRGVMNNVVFAQGSEVTLSAWAEIINGTCGGDPTNEAEIKINGASLNMSHWTGNLKLTNKIGTDRTVINCDSGNIIIDSTCVSGSIQLLGTGIVESDNSGDNCHVDTDGFISTVNITDSVWDEQSSGHVASGSFGDILNTSSADLKRILGLMHENIYIDNPVYDSDNNLTSARVRIYSVPGSVGTTNDIIGTYTISAPSTAPGKFTSWSQIKV